MGKKEGYILLYRKIQKQWFWRGKFSQGQAFVDLLLMANHSERVVNLGKMTVLVKRGQLLTSQIKLAKRWGWSRSMVYKFLKRLELEKILTVAGESGRVGGRGYSLISLLNYSKYQDKPSDGGRVGGRVRWHKQIMYITNNEQQQIYNNVVVEKSNFLNPLLEEYLRGNKQIKVFYQGNPVGFNRVLNKWRVCVDGEWVDYDGELKDLDIYVNNQAIDKGQTQ